VRDHGKAAVERCLAGPCGDSAVDGEFASLLPFGREVHKKCLPAGMLSPVTHTRVARAHEQL
jgi:hypothetical protein